MRFFIDAANLDQIRGVDELGVLDDMATNPSLVAKEEVRGVENQRKRYLGVYKIVNGGVSAEVVATNLEGMIRGGKKLAASHPNIVVKAPHTETGIKAVKYFTRGGIRTNCVLIFSVGQALLAAKARATYVSPLVKRLDDIASDGIELVREVVEMYSYYGCDTQVLAASICNTQHIVQRAEAGANVTTYPLSTIKGLSKHLLADSGLATFLADCKEVNGQEKNSTFMRINS